jgi:hypothetical protein
VQSATGGVLRDQGREADAQHAHRALTGFPYIAALKETPMPTANGQPPGGGYTYRGTGRSLTAAEAEAASRNGHPAAPPPRAPATPAVQVPALKGAVKVSAFPGRSMYPFREIADDGGVWKLDPAAFTWRGKPGQPQSIRTAASKWAIDHEMKAKVVIDAGDVYVQFTKRP